MINTKNLAGSIRDVPSAWVFNHYLGLDLSGQDVMIKSIFNHKDTIPSLSIYVKGGQYKYYDFSTGEGGDKIQFVMKKENLKFPEACDEILYKYNHLGSEVKDFKAHNKFKVTDCVRRKWNVLDKKYWQQYEIGSVELEHFKVFPLKSYRLFNTERELIISGEYIYGFFTLSGELYKVYQPMVKDRRFLKVKDHIQGLDQYMGVSDLCIITSSLKDVISLYNMGWEAIAPDSENIILPEKALRSIKADKITLMNNDEAGLKSMEKYKARGIPGIVSNMEKDPSDSVKRWGEEHVSKELGRLIENERNEKDRS